MIGLLVTSQGYRLDSC